jgi:hypothetical protein
VDAKFAETRIQNGERDKTKRKEDEDLLESNFSHKIVIFDQNVASLPVLF